VINFIIENLPKFTGGALDAGGNGSQVGEDTAAKFGATRIAQIMLSESWYREHMPKLKSGLEDRTIQDIPRNSNLRDDLRAVEVINGVPKIAERTKNAEDKKQKRHGDFAIALALANYATFEMCAGPVRVCSRGSSGAKTSKKNGKKRGKVRQARKPDALRGYPS
jgi:phage FluMu gp28-like protein